MGSIVVRTLPRAPAARCSVDRAHGGGFTWLEYVHEFIEHNGTTEMIDRLDWQASWGVLGKVADRLFVERHMSWYLTTKQRAFKALAEDGE